VISEVGEGVKTVKVGDKVIGAMATTGTMAEEIIVKASVVIPMPETLSFEEAAGFGVGYMTAYHGYSFFFNRYLPNSSFSCYALLFFT
jgi:NADPH2:quinone reductase